LLLKILGAQAENLGAHLKSACNEIIQIFPKITVILTNSLIIKRFNVQIL